MEFVYMFSFYFFGNFKILLKGVKLKMLRIIKFLMLIPKGFRLKDSITIGLFGGLIGTLIVDLSNLLLWKKNKTEILYAHLGASMFMRPFRTNQKKNFILGQLFHMITGASLGVPIFYMLKKTGKDYLILKGAFGGAFTWGALYSFGINKGFYSAKPHLTKTHYSYLFHNFLFGIVSAVSMVWLSDPSVFPSEKQQDVRENRVSHIPRYTPPLLTPPSPPTYSPDFETPRGIH
jgi:hypothetical protein